ncbi:unnamed protein product, partial [Meganyctiphanes norvegica]
MGVWETILHELHQSVQSGRVRTGVVGGGVMEDGRARAPVTAARAIPSAAQRKVQSLPGYYSRVQQPQPPQTQSSTFRDAFTTNQGVPAQGIPPVTPPRGLPSPRALPKVAQVTAITNKQQLQQQPQLVQWSHQQQQQQLQREYMQQQQALHKQHLQQQQLQNKQMPQQTQQNTKKQPAVPPNATPPTEKKHKKGILGGIFRRRSKKDVQQSDSSSNSDAEDQTQTNKRSFLRRRSKRKSSKETAPPPHPPPPKEENLLPQPGNVRVTMDVDPNTPTSPLGKEINLIVSPDGKRMLRVSPSRTHSLGREGQQHILGIPLLIPPPGQLGRHGVSVSHDSLPVSLNNSSMASHGGSVYSMGNMNMRSSSNETISKKERREQLKARVERLRDRIKGSSSDEEKASISSHSMYGSETSLSNTNSLTKRSRTARTERFLRRKSQELETLRNETEKDKKTREAVQARIEEIQKIQKFEAERNIINAEKILQAEEENKRLYGNNVYEESSVSDSPRAYRTPSCITPSYSPATSPHLKKKVINDTVPIPPKETVILRNKPNHPHQTVTVSLAPPLGTPLRRSFQDHELPFSNDLRGHRSASYDSSINRSSLGSTTPYGSRIVSPVTGVTVTPLNRSGMTPPPPPPRDPSRILSPGGVDSRPTSFSFESLNQETQRPTSGLNNRNFMKGSSPSPSIRSVPTYLGPKPIGQVTELPPPSVPQRRSLSEVQLTPQPHAQLQQQQQQLQQQAPPPRPVPPNISNGNYNYTDQPPKSVTKPSKNQQIPVQQNLDSQQSYYIDTNPQYAKIVPISNIPPSPSSDYSSYMSDNSVKLQKVNNAWRQKDLKNKNVPPHVFSDSSRSNSPSAGTLQGFATSPQNDTYGIIKPKKSKPPPLNLKQAESLSSLSGHSDVPSPVQKTTLDKSIDSDSSNGSLSKDNKNKPQNRPLSMVLDKSEPVDKMTPPVTPRRPHPTRRNSPQITSASFETAKKQMQDIIKHNKECTGENLAQFEQMYKNERERLEKARCTNLEDALLELEEIYNSLKLDSDDLLDRAERRDLPTAHQLLRGSEVAHEKHNESNSETWDTDSINGCERRSRTPSQRRSGIPDVEMDDMHYRRCNQNNRNQPDVQKALQNTGSYLLASPALTPPSDIDFDMPKDPMLEDQPDLVFDDVSYRNIQRANSIKIIDPQPPFGIPLGPTTQGSESDYLHVTPKENYRPKMISRIHPDIAMDDYAYRNLRKDNKEVNVAELDELLSESYNSESPVHRKRNNRSVSADRNRSSQNSINTSLTSQPDRGHTKVQTPRKVKQQDARRSGKFFDCYKDAFINVESGPLSPRNNPSWLERAQLVDNKWDSVSTKTNSSSNTNISLSTSTETLTELSSVRAVSQPDIRQAIIREARVAIGGPLECELKHTTPQKGSTTVTPTSSFIPMASTPKVVNMQVIKSAPASPVTTERKPYRPLDSIFNAKPKPFYLAEPKPEEKPSHKIVRPEPKLAQTPVDIAKLDALISSLSNMENNEDQADISSVNSLKSYKKTHIKNASETKHKEKSLNVENINDPHTYETQNSRVNELTIVEPENIEPQTNMIDTTLKSEDEEKGFAKANIQKAIRLSMALESSSSEGERPEDQDRYHRRQNSDKVRSGVAPRVRSEASSINNSAICQDKLQEREQRDKKKEYDRLKITQRERQSQQQKQNNNNNNTDETKRRSNDKSSRLHQQQQQHKKRVVDEREKRKSIERDKRRSEEREVKNQRSSEERDKRSRTSPEKLVKRKVVDERDVQKTKIKNSNRHSQSPEKTRRSLTPEKRRSSSSSSNKMVQQLHEQQQQQQQQQTKQQQQLQDSSSTSVQDMDSEKADAERRERIQRYKDERRKQIAARYGGAEWSSSEESGGDDTPSRSYRRRRRAKDAQDTSSTEQSTLETRRGHENGSSLEGRRKRRLRGGSSSEDVVQGVGRSSNRTARLRQSPLSHIAATNLLNDNATADDNRNSPLPTPPTEGGSEVSSELPPLRRPTDIVAALDSPRGLIDSAESPLSGSDTRSGRRRGQGNKDKSNKRMSNLNRATTSEETADLYVLSQPSDSNEDTPRRRRRRAPVSPSGSSGLSAVISPEPLKTPDVVRNVVARLTPPASPTPLQSPQLHPSNSFQSIQPADGPGSQSAPSTLDTRARQAHGSDTRRHSGVIQDANNVDIEETYSRKHPPKLGPLRKPEIPDVLRPKDTTSLASPGVVNTPNNSRPSSVVLDKPPLGPEGLRPAALRSSLRKPPDAGTCFMASRREKVNETKPPTDNFLRELQQRPKKGDRLSKSDLNLKFDELSPTGGSGTSELEPALSSPSLLSPSKHSPFSEENLSNRLDQISARARDTLERVDRLAVEDCPPSVPDSSPPEDSADNMVHECEEYLTVNASNKKDTGSSVVHRETKKGTSTKSTNQSSSLTSKKGVISDTGQKNWHGGSEGSGKESKRLVMEKEVNKELKKDYQILGRDKFNRNTSASPSGPPDNTTHKNNNNNVEPPPDEVIHGLLRRKNTENDTGSQDNSISQSPEHQSKRGSRRCSLDGDSSRNDSPDPMSILKRKSSREDIATERPTTPETHSILKRKTSSRNSSVDTSESDPISILKKKTSAEELDMFEPRPILKKKSSTDDELDDRPRSILKGGRSREDLERLEGIVSPTPILKRSPRCDSDGEGEPERRSILKRRDTTDGVRLRLNVSDSEDVDGDTPSLRVRSDSAPEASSLRSRGRSPPASTAVPSHGILKRRSHTSPARMDQIDNELGAILRSRRSLATDDQESENETSVTRPISPSLKVSTREGERPLSVAERIAGMEASKADISPIVRRSPSPNPCRSPGVRPKVRPTSFERPPTPDHDRVKNDAYLLVAEGAQNNGNVAGVEAVNCHLMDSAPDGVVLLDHSTSASSTDPQDQETPDTPSSVSQRAAFFAQLEKEKKPESPTTPTRSSRFGRRERSARCQTQPVTETEVCAAARLADTSDSASHDSDGPSASHSTSDSPSKSMFRNAREAMMRSAEEVMAGLSGTVSPRKKYGSRKTSLNEPDEEQQTSDSAKG